MWQPHEPPAQEVEDWAETCAQAAAQLCRKLTPELQRRGFPAYLTEPNPARRGSVVRFRRRTSPRHLQHSPFLHLRPARHRELVHRLRCSRATWPSPFPNHPRQPTPQPLPRSPPEPPTPLPPPPLHFSYS